MVKKAQCPWKVLMEKLMPVEQSSFNRQLLAAAEERRYG